MQPQPDEIWAARAKWHYRGQKCPSWAPQPSPGQESVWEYPRPPRLMPDPRYVIVRVKGKVLADSSSTVRVLETASPPAFYLPPEDVELSRLILTEISSVCEWKGIAQYWALQEAENAREPVAWAYPHPYPEFEALAGYLSFYPGRVECYVNQERVIPQPGGLYGGWITREIIGPCKGSPGTAHW